LAYLDGSIFSTSDHLFSGSRDGTLKRWELNNGDASFSGTFESHVDWVCFFLFLIIRLTVSSISALNIHYVYKLVMFMFNMVSVVYYLDPKLSTFLVSIYFSINILIDILSSLC
jgi:WD40 repeat protein